MAYGPRQLVKLKRLPQEVGPRLQFQPADESVVGYVLGGLGGQLFGPSFCEDHSGATDHCTHAVGCSIRSLWTTVQSVLDGVLGRITLMDLLREESQLEDGFQGMAEELLQVSNWD